LHQKLNEPRSFDYSRKLAWDDRLRMPQFRFARDAARHKDEDPVKAAVEEVEAREAVMTFVLGLVAEPVPNAYTPHPDTDRQAEIKGRQVLDKFNCAGCHMIRAGVYDFKLTDDAREELASSYKAAKSEIDAGYDEFYKNHNAWTGAEQKRTDRLRVFGLQWNRDKGKLRPTQAVRFEDKDNGVRNIPSGTLLSLPADSLMQLTSQAGPLDPTPYGGYFGDLLMGDGGPGSYMNSHPNLPSGPAEEVRRAVLPPPLHREGEKVQPGWLQRFLRDPKPIRPPERMLLRMPKFNMSDEEIDAIVRYFIAVDRLENPGASTTNAWLPPEQLNVEFWQKRNAEYLKKLGDKLKKREEDETLQDPLKNFIEFRIVPEIPGLLEQKKAQVLVQEDVIKKLKDDKTASDKDKEAAETKLKQLKDEQKSLEERVNDLKKDPDKAREAETKKALPEYVQRWKSNETYATDAYHLLVSRSTKDTTCLKCHNIAENEASDRQGPTLFFRKDQMLFQTAAGGSQQSEGEAYIASERLRPEWVQRWVAQPKRLHGYDTPMVQVFLKDPTDLQKRLFEADDKADPTKAQADRITALRDVLMNTPPVADLPPNRFYRPKIEGQK
jgi:mono/diheme cytochrome c family protein